DAQNRKPSVTATEASPSTMSPKPFIKFVKAVDRLAERPTTNKVETAKKPSVKYAEQYRKPTKKSTVRGNQQNWNNLKSQQLDGKLASLLIASKDLDNLIESQRADKNKGGLGYSVVPPPLAQIYSSPKKDLSWTGFLEFADDTVTDYSRHAPTIESSPDDAQNRKPSVTATEASPSTMSPKPFIK
nr:hypothetical protein [Tanacetum cinerariifolium]